MNKLKLTKLILLLAVISFTCFFETTIAQQATLETHQDLNQEALRFWYSNPSKPSHLFNRNIAPKGDCIQAINGYVFISWFKGGMTTRNLMLSRLYIATNKWKHLEFPIANFSEKRDYFLSYQIQHQRESLILPTTNHGKFFRYLVLK